MLPLPQASCSHCPHNLFSRQSPCSSPRPRMAEVLGFAPRVSNPVPSKGCLGWSCPMGPSSWPGIPGRSLGGSRDLRLWARGREGSPPFLRVPLPASPSQLPTLISPPSAPMPRPPSAPSLHLPQGAGAPPCFCSPSLPRLSLAFLTCVCNTRGVAMVWLWRSHVISTTGSRPAESSESRGQGA